MNYSTVLSEEKQIIYYDFIKKLFNLLYKSCNSSVSYETVIVNTK